MTPLTTSDDRRRLWPILIVLGMIAAGCFGSVLLTGCAAIDAARNVDK